MKANSGGWIRTNDLRVMSPTSYQTALPRNQVGTIGLNPAAVNAPFVLERITEESGIRRFKGMPDVGVIILARLDSERFPGKVLADAAGVPLLTRLVERLAASSDAIGPVVLATTVRQIDDPLESWARRSGVPIVRSSRPLNDVAGRFVDAAIEHRFEWAFRVNGDSPHTDASLLAGSMSLRALDIDLVSNLVSRRFPYGVAVELVRIDALARVLHSLPADDPTREHVTRPLYERLAPERIAHVPGGDPAWANLRATVDTPEDLERFTRYLQDVGPEWPITTLGRLIEWSEARSET